MGDRLSPVPLTQDRIGKAKYIDMYDLLFEFWITPCSKEEMALQRLASSMGHKQTLEIHFWLLCFAVYMVVVDSKYQNWVLEMMACMIQIIRTNQKNEWFAYVDACRRQAE